MIHDLTDYELLPEPCKNSLTFLRNVRDRLAESVRRDICDEDADAWIEDLCAFEYSASAHARIVKYHTQGGTLGHLEKVHLLYTIVRRIARLEREALGIPLERNLQSA